MNLTARLRRAFDTQARYYEYAELSTPPAVDGIKGDWAVCYGTGVPTYYGPKPSDAAWPAGSANPGPTGATGPSIAAWATATAFTLGQTVVFNRVTYTALTAHTSTTFRADLAAGAWAQMNSPSGGRVETLDPALLASLQAWPAVLRAYYWRVTGAGAISKLDAEIGIQSGNLLLAVYANNGSDGIAAFPAAGGLIASTGSFACPAVGKFSQTLGSTVGVAAGDWIMACCDNVTTKFRAVGVASGGGDSLGRVGYEVLGSLTAPTNPTPTVFAATYLPWIGGE